MGPLTPARMRVIALIAAYNEERMIGPVLDHLTGQGVEVYLLDNESTDRTPEIAKGYLGRGLLGVERLRTNEIYSLPTILRRKQELARELSGDWFLHQDTDEWRLGPSPQSTLVEALEKVDREGYNAVDFDEFVFVPTRQAPDHDHPEFVRTMRHYYYFRPRPQHRVNAWKRTKGPVDLLIEGGHRAAFPGRRIHPQPFVLRHYICLSRSHAVLKYCERRFSKEGLRRG